MVFSDSSRASSFEEMGMKLFEEGNIKKSTDYLKQSLSYYIKLKDNDSIGRLLYNIGYNYSVEKNYSDAVEYYDRAFNIFSMLNDSERMAITCDNLGIAYYIIGEYDKAIAASNIPISYYVLNKDAKNIMNNLLNIKECLLDSIKYHGCNKIIIKYVLKTIYELYQIEIEEDYEKEKMGYIHNLDPLNYYLVEEVDRKMLYYYIFINTNKLVDLLIEILDDKDENEYIRAIAANALGYPKQDIDKILYALRNNYTTDSISIKRNIAFSLWGKSHPSLISTYIKSAEDPDPIVRGYSLRTLGHIGKNTQQIRNTILNHLHDPSQHVQNEARDALAELNQKLK